MQEEVNGEGMHEGDVGKGYRGVGCRGRGKEDIGGRSPYPFDLCSDLHTTICLQILITYSLISGLHNESFASNTTKLHKDNEKVKYMQHTFSQLLNHVKDR